MLLLGGYTPVRGFLGADDVAAVRDTGTLADGSTWPVPITLTIPTEVGNRAASVGGLSGRMRKLQNGFARSYAVSMFGGAAILVAAILLMRAV